MPTFPAVWTLADPRGRPYFVFWTMADGTLTHAVRMEGEADGTGVRITIPYVGSYHLDLLRRPTARRGGAMTLYRCPTCRRPRRYLYLLSLVGDRLVKSLGPQCQACAGLRWASQGRYIGAAIRELHAVLTGIPNRLVPLPRTNLWDPGAVSDPALVMDQFPEYFRD